LWLAGYRAGAKAAWRDGFLSGATIVPCIAGLLAIAIGVRITVSALMSDRPTSLAHDVRQLAAKVAGPP
jgi:hypothetical protein